MPVLMMGLEPDGDCRYVEFTCGHREDESLRPIDHVAMRTVDAWRTASG
jgi:hypothetical protein